ncbi:DUF6526 family protein [Urechidicola croceus]|uniref:Uncharacterized protein n=1 Tax=Urechidicola croceus TaxID=1850246 RepID=A0A1D8P6Y7_9FLAO|nr:DUF6526 family protein [Urechidicola croceus]AOW20336.1 hypothetical protein LPB138_06425 [Urechidicola croceus]
MEHQNLKNHGRLLVGYHFVGSVLILALLIGSIINLVKSSTSNIYSASLLVLVTIILILVTYYARAFALKAQDRAINAEESIRHFILTGKPLSNELSIRQIIGLRFASDEEFPDLAKKAVAEKLSEKDIKKAIKNWKADTYRV